MITYKIKNKTKLKVNTAKQGEPLEHKIERIVTQKEPIKDGAPIIYTERKDGVNPSHNIRTDRFEVAAEAMSKVSKSFKAKREERNKPTQKTDETIGKPDSLVYLS